MRLGALTFVIWSFLEGDPGLVWSAYESQKGYDSAVVGGCDSAKWDAVEDGVALAGTNRDAFNVLLRLCED